MKRSIVWCEHLLRSELKLKIKFFAFILLVRLVLFATSRQDKGIALSIHPVRTHLQVLILT